MTKKKADIEETTDELTPEPEPVPDEPTPKRAAVRVVADETPEQFLILKPMVSRSRGEMVMPGTVVTRDGFLRGNSDDDINLYLQMGALRPHVDNDKDVSNG